MSSISSSSEHIVQNSQTGIDEGSDKLTITYTTVKTSNEAQKKHSPSLRRQRPKKFEQNLRAYQVLSKKQFHQEQDQIVQKVQKEKPKQNESYFTIDTSKKIKTFKNGWLKNEKLMQQHLEEEKQNIHPILCPLANDFEKIVQQNEEQGSNVKKLQNQFIKQEEDSYSDSIVQEFYQGEKCQQSFQKLPGFKKGEYENSEQNHCLVNQYVDVPLSYDDIFGIEENQYISPQQCLQKGQENKSKIFEAKVMEEQISSLEQEQSCNQQELQNLAAVTSKKKNQTPQKSGKIDTENFLVQIKIEQSSEKRRSPKPEPVRFIPILSNKKYFSLRLLRQLFDSLTIKNSNSFKKMANVSQKTDPYKKQFKYLSNSTCQTRLEGMNSIEEIARYLKSQKPFLKNQEIINVLKQFIVQEGLSSEFYNPQLDKIIFD